MSTIRHFSGSREAGKKSIAKEILQIEMQKKGKMPAEMRYKLIFKRKQQEAREKAMKAMSQTSNSSKMVAQRKMSPRAEQALKEIAMKKAAKEQKALRRMVIVQPQNFSNGRIDKKGQIFDLAGNIVGKVNTKNGKMATMSGWTIGKYKPKSYMTKLLIEQAINQHSPYFIQQRKLLAMQQAMAASGGMYGVHGPVMDPNVLNVHGTSAHGAMLGGGMYNNLGQGDHGVFGRDEHASSTQWVGGSQQSLGSTGAVTAWGATSNNVWGTYSGNVHGTVGDNVFGTSASDVWGTATRDQLWGTKSVQLYGTGSGVNHLAGLTKFILGLFGYQSKAARQALRQAAALRAAGAGSGGGRPAAAPRGGGRR